MNENKDGENILELSIDDLFKDEDVTPASEEEKEAKKLELTQGMTKRINEVRAKTEKETKDNLAKELGFESYEAMKKAKEDELISKKGYNPKDIKEVLDPLVEKRLADDPRFKELEAFKARERDAYIQAQLTAINEATGQQLKIADLPQATLDLWAKGLNLEEAYYATHGKQIITKVKSEVSNGSLSHLATGGGAGQPKLRRLTEEEKAMYRAIAPHMTEEELNKKTTPVTGK